MNWLLVYTTHARRDAKKLARSGLKPQAQKLLDLLAEDPCRTPPPYEKLVGDLAGACSRRINIQHRLVYQVLHDIRTVKIIRMWTYYEQNGEPDAERSADGEDQLEQMTSREIVSRAIHFRTPPRLPVTMGCFGVDDTGWVGSKLPEGWKPAVAGADEWGCVWDKTDVENMGQVKGHPLSDISKLSAFRPPDFRDASRYVDVAANLDKIEAQGKYVISGIFMVLFERMHSLHGFENTLVDLYDNRPAMEDLADMIVETHVTLVRETCRRVPYRIHGWGMSDDWGTQTAAFVSFELWMDFFFPRYKRIFDAMHEAGCDVWVHSCGKVNEIIEGYIRAGVNVLNLQQPRALGIREIGERYRGRIAFQSLADIQATLPTGERRRVAEDADMLMANWATPQGGFVFSDYGSDAAIGVKDSAIKRFMYDEFSRRSKHLYGEALPPPVSPT